MEWEKMFLNDVTEKGLFSNTTEWLHFSSLFTAKKTFKKMKKQPMEWEKIFVNDVTDKGLFSKVHKTVHIAWYRDTNSPMDRRLE